LSNLIFGTDNRRVRQGANTDRLLCFDGLRAADVEREWTGLCRLIRARLLAVGERHPAADADISPRSPSWGRDLACSVFNLISNARANDSAGMPDGGSGHASGQRLVS
jgi:hypothetical protein